MGALLTQLQKVIDAANRRDREGFLNSLADDVEYKMHVNARTFNSKEWVARFLDRHWETSRDSKWWVDRSTESGNILMCEGAEEYVISATGEKVSHSYMGVYEFGADGKIAKMREYFEMKDPRVAKPAAKT
jgi:ketosteroid isomerase-like protein